MLSLQELVLLATARLEPATVLEITQEVSRISSKWEDVTTSAVKLCLDRLVRADEVVRSQRERSTTIVFSVNRGA